jgi:hypothetical protein
LIFASSFAVALAAAPRLPDLSTRFVVLSGLKASSSSLSTPPDIVSTLQVSSVSSEIVAWHPPWMESTVAARSATDGADGLTSGKLGKLLWRVLPALLDLVLFLVEGILVIWRGNRRGLWTVSSA